MKALLAKIAHSCYFLVRIEANAQDVKEKITDKEA
jgi:hypothetical protein